MLNNSFPINLPAQVSVIPLPTANPGVLLGGQYVRKTRQRGSLGVNWMTTPLEEVPYPYICVRLKGTNKYIIRNPSGKHTRYDPTEIDGIRRIPLYFNSLKEAYNFIQQYKRGWLVRDATYKVSKMSTANDRSQMEFEIVYLSSQTAFKEVQGFKDSPNNLYVGLTT